MSDLRIHLFQRFQIFYLGSALGGFGSQRVQELICYLLLFRDRAHHREVLASQLWESGTPASAKKNLRQVLWQINGAVAHADADRQRNFVVADREWIQVDGETEFWLDVDEFEAQYQIVKGKRGAQLSQAEAQSLESAIQLYSGHLLEGWYYDWCLYERERLHNIYLVMLDKYLSFAETKRRYDTGLYYGAMALRNDPARERTHRRLMRLHYLAGHRAMALRQYESCCVALQSELGIEPAERTKRLYDEMLHERFDTADDQIDPDRLENPVDALSAQLDRLQATMDSVQAELHHLRRLLRG